jgi:two-component system, NtrC family, nitrogen regulation sensor histidine kinase NtrY
MSWDCRAVHYTEESRPMVFKNFRFHIIIRVLLLTATVTLFAWCVVLEYYLRSIYLGAAVLIILIELVWYTDRFNRDLKNFLTSLLQNDFTTHFNTTGNGKSIDELYSMLNKIAAAFRNISVQKEVQFRYLEMLFEHVRVGILSLDATGKVQHANQALKTMLQKNILPDLYAFESIDASLANTIREIRTGETRLVKLRVQHEVLQLSIHASEFKLEDMYYKLISMQNIRQELDIHEMDAWQKLIHVMSHEIMNSVSPIISLSSTLHGLVVQSKAAHEPLPSLYDSLNQGLDAIRIRSEGLYNFTKTYRKLAAIPKLNLTETNLREIIQRVEILMAARIKEQGIGLTITDIDQPVMADPALLEHVLINLLLNAMDAVAGKAAPAIHIYTTRSLKGQVTIHVRDNGEGMDENTLEKIFIPFYTTKKNGSGIGLAISKQILQLHHADIRVTSTPAQGTEFIITL